MANPEHLAKLEEGSKAWNLWRKENSEIIPDISGTNLRGADLFGLKLRGVDFNRVNLSGANLSGANLREANLREADLREAKLIGANLIGADLSGANLFKANLNTADTREANLREANLREADLSGARLIYTVLDNANLTGAKLWETNRYRWSIKGVICEYAYLEGTGEEDRTEYAPGQFEKLYSDGVRIDLYYEEGISPIEINTLPLLINQLQQMNEGCKLRFKSIEESSDGAKVTIAVDNAGGVDIKKLREEAGQFKNAQAMLLKTEKDRDEINLELKVLYGKILPMIMKNMGPENQFNISGGEVRGLVGGIKGSGPVEIGRTQNFTLNDLEAITRMIELVSSKHDEIEGAVSDEDFKTLKADIETLKAQTEAPKPNGSIIKETLGSLRRIAESAASSAISSKIPEWIEAIQRVMH